MAEKNNTKEVKKKSTKRPSPTFDSDCIYAWRTIPVSKAFVDRLLQRLLLWIDENPKAKFITDFYTKEGLKKDNYYTLVNRYPDLKDAHELVMRKLGERLLSKAIDKEVHWPAAHFMLHNFGQEFDDANKYHARLKQEETKQEPTQFIVQIPDFPSSDKVPKKLKKDE